jgi:hypothetical protein
MMKFVVIAMGGVFIVHGKDARMDLMNDLADTGVPYEAIWWDLE